MKLKPKPIIEDRHCMPAARRAWISIVLTTHRLLRERAAGMGGLFPEENRLLREIEIDVWLSRCEQILEKNHRDLFTDLEPPK